MTCEACLEILDLPETLRTSDEARAFRRHLEQCPDCRAEYERLEGAMAAFLGAPDPEPVGSSLDPMLRGLRGGAPGGAGSSVQTRAEGRAGSRSADGAGSRGEGRAGSRSADGAGSKGEGRAGSPDSRSRSLEDRGGGAVNAPGGFSSLLRTWIERLLPIRIWIPAVVAMLLLAVALPRHATRDKGPLPASTRPTIDLQASIERGHGSGPRLEAAIDGAHLSPQDGLLFQVVIEGSSQVTLVERDPEHRLRVLFQAAGPVDPAPGVWVFQPAGPSGRPLRYVPDGPPGEYVFIAVASSGPLELGPAQLDALWNRYVNRVLEPFAPGTVDSEPWSPPPSVRSGTAAGDRPLLPQGTVLDALTVEYEALSGTRPHDPSSGHLGGPAGGPSSAPAGGEGAP